MREHAFLYGAGAGGLGLLGLIVGDFALQWQPVAADVPGRNVLAHASAIALMLASGSLIAWYRPVQGAYAMFLLYGTWVFALHAPRVLAAPTEILTWLGFAEILALASAGPLLGLASGRSASPGARRAALFIFGACPIVWGLSHFGYPEGTASMIPSWIPGGLFWAYATGAGHIAAGVAILAGTVAAVALPDDSRARAVASALCRAAAVMLTAMLGSFTLLVHLTGVLRDPASRLEWTMLFVATSLTGAAWVTAASLRSTRTRVTQLRPEPA